MTIRIEPFDPHTASDELWAAFNATRRAIAVELWPDEPVLDDAETRREVQTTNPMVEFRRWVAMEGDEVAGSIRAAFRRPGTANEEDYARFLWAGGGVRASSRRRGVGTLLLREVHCLMHTLDKTVLTMTTHAASGHASSNMSVPSRSIARWSSARSSPTSTGLASDSGKTGQPLRD